MSRYIRNFQKGAWYFFTVVSHSRQPILIKNIERLRSSFKSVKQNHPFSIEGIVILPDHIHCVWKLPDSDCDYSKRWRLIKGHFSRGISVAKNNKGEKLVWQRRYWEHTLRDDLDLHKHMAYIHYNPVKHGYVKKVSDWRYSSFNNLVEKGFYHKSWGNVEPIEIKELDFE